MTNSMKMTPYTALLIENRRADVALATRASASLPYTYFRVEHAVNLVEAVDRLTVLLVDDDPEIARAASLRLIAAGYDTLTAYDGQAAVASAASRRPNVVVLDVRMPNQDGLATLAELKQRQDTKDIPVIMLSASIGDQQAALDAGARCFLRKPYRGEALVQAVTSVVRAAHSEVSSARFGGPSRQAVKGPNATFDEGGRDARFMTAGPVPASHNGL